MIEIKDKKVRFNGRELEGEYPIHEVYLEEDRLFVLYKPESFKGGQFRNLVAFSLSGNELWKAELPTNMSMDAYYHIVSGSPIVANSFSSYRCMIDAVTGQIIKKDFFK